MQCKIITLLTVGLLFSTILNAIDEDRDHSFIIKAKGQQELKTLKDIHYYNEIFDNYHLGGIAPDIIEEKGK